MADNYIERREAELKSGGRTVYKRNTPSLDTLLLKNRSHRAFDTSYAVAMRQLETIVSVNDKIPSGRNAQCLRFKLLDEQSGGRDFCRFLHLGGYLPELHLPAPGTKPRAFIIVCCTQQESPTVDIDLGAVVQIDGVSAAALAGACAGAAGRFGHRQGHGPNRTGRGSRRIRPSVLPERRDTFRPQNQAGRPIAIGPLEGCHQLLDRLAD